MFLIASPSEGISCVSSKRSNELLELEKEGDLGGGDDVSADDEYFRLDPHSHNV